MSSSNGGIGKIIKLGVILLIVTAVTGFILGVVHEITADPIRQTRERLRNEAFAAALPEAESFEEVALDGDTVIDVGGASIPIADVRRGVSNGDTVGWCVTVKPSGYGGQITMVVGVRDDGGLRGMRILGEGFSETPGLGGNARSPQFIAQFDRSPSDPAVKRIALVKVAPQQSEEIQAISGATITSNAVTRGVTAALEFCADNMK